MTNQFTPQAPFQAARPARDRGQIIGGSLVAVAGLMALPNFIRWVEAVSEYGFHYFDLSTFFYFAIATIGGVALAPIAVLGLFTNKKVVIFAGLGWVFLRLLVVSVVTLIHSAQVGGLNLYNWIIGSDWEQFLSFISIVFALGGSLFVALTKATTTNPEPAFMPSAYQESATGQVAAPAQTGTAPGWYFDPSVGGQRYWDGSTWLSIPAPIGAAPQGQPGQPAAAPGIAVAAFVLSLVMPLVGLIMGYVARNQARISPNPQAGASLIKAAITIGWIFTILGFVGSIIYGIAMATLLNQGYY